MMNNFMNAIKERFANAKSDESGGGLITILGVSMLTLIVVSSVTMSAAISTTFTYSQLSGQQSNDYTDAALDEAISQLSLKSNSAETCKPRSVDNSEIIYTIKSSSWDRQPTSTSPELITRCPQPGDKWVVVEAKGKGKNDSTSSKTAMFKVVGNGDDTVISGVKGDTDSILPHAITAGSMNLSRVGELKSAKGLTASQPSIYINNGIASATNDINKMPLLCGGTTNPINANVFYNNRNEDNHPQWLSFSVAPEYGCDINGNVITDNTGLSIKSESATTKIKGDVCSYAGISDNGKKIVGNTLRNNSDCGFYGTMYGYQPVPDNITKSFTGTNEGCRTPLELKTAVESVVDTSNKNYILDFSKCTFYGYWSNTTVKELNISANITIIPPNYATSSSTTKNMLLSDFLIKSKDGKNHSFNIVKPSATPDSTKSDPTAMCGTGDIVTKINYSEGISGVIYTPCSLSVVNSNIIGQIYSGNRLTLNGGSLTYMPTPLTDGFFKIDTSKGKPYELIRIS